MQYVLCTVYCVQFNMNYVLWILCLVQCNMDYVLCTLYNAICTMYCELRNLYNAICTMYCTMQYVLCTAQCNMYYILCTVVEKWGESCCSTVSYGVIRRGWMGGGSFTLLLVIFLSIPYCAGREDVAARNARAKDINKPWTWETQMMNKIRPKKTTQKRWNMTCWGPALKPSK